MPMSTVAGSVTGTPHLWHGLLRKSHVIDGDRVTSGEVLTRPCQECLSEKKT